jgi:hypothetical protein
VAAISSADLIEQIDRLGAEYDELREQSQYQDLSDYDKTGNEQAVFSLGLRATAAAQRLLPAGTAYIEQADDYIDTLGGRNPGQLTYRLLTILRAFRTDLEAGWLRDFEEAVHAGVFADFLDMAEYVLEEIHKTPAAVIAGFTLEEHLRKLCAKHGIATEQDGKPIKADAMNAELGKVAYSKTVQKEVTGWLGRRNEAAHGNHDAYNEEQVSLMIENVRHFIGANPA